MSHKFRACLINIRIGERLEPQFSTSHHLRMVLGISIHKIPQKPVATPSWMSAASMAVLNESRNGDHWIRVDTVKKELYNLDSETNFQLQNRATRTSVAANELLCQIITSAIDWISERSNSRKEDLHVRVYQLLHCRPPISIMLWKAQAETMMSSAM